MLENRRHPRKQVTASIAFQIGDGPLVEAESRDISLGGMYIETDAAIPYGTQVRVYIALPGMRQDTVIDSIVRWTTPLGAGVQFGQMGARETHALTLLLSGSQYPPPPSG